MITSSYMASTLELMGYSNQALEMNQKALSLARELGNPYSLAFALDFSAVFRHIRREAKEAQMMAEEAIALSTEQGFLQWIAHGMILRGWALVEQGHKEEGEGQIQEGLGAWRATGAGLALPYYLTPLVETKIRRERAEEGQRVLNEALSIAQANQDGFFVPELYRLKGELLMLTGEMEEEIEKCFNTAIDMARRQNAKVLELRATVDFCRFLIKQNKAKEAKDLLKKIYDFFTEGLDTPNMQEAKQLLDELS